MYHREFRGNYNGIYTFKASQPVRVEKPLLCYSTAHSLRLQNSSERLRLPSRSLPPTAGHVCFCKLQRAFWELQSLKSSSSEQPAKRSSQAGHPTSDPSTEPAVASLSWVLQNFIPSTLGQSRWRTQQYPY